jgi:hypothetical protein
VRSLRAGLPLGLRFRTKGELAIEICQEIAADGVTPDFTYRDEASDAFSCQVAGGNLCCQAATGMAARAGNAVVSS